MNTNVIIADRCELNSLGLVAALTEPAFGWTSLPQVGGLKRKKHPYRCFLVDPERFELSTFSMPLRRAPNCAMGPCLLYSFVFHSAPNSPGRGLRALWALAYSILLFSMALPIPRGGDFVRYRPSTKFLKWTWRDSNPRPLQCD